MARHLYQNLYQNQTLVVSSVLVVKVVSVISGVLLHALILIIVSDLTHIISHHILPSHVHLHVRLFSVIAGFYEPMQLFFP